MRILLPDSWNLSTALCPLSSQDEFVVTDDNLEESEEDQPSNDDSDADFSRRRPRRHHSRPMRQSRRLRRKSIKKRYSEDDEEEDSEDNVSGDSGKFHLFTVRSFVAVQFLIVRYSWTKDFGYDHIKGLYKYILMVLIDLRFFFLFICA